MKKISTLFITLLFAICVCIQLYGQEPHSSGITIEITHSYSVGNKGYIRFLVTNTSEEDVRIESIIREFGDYMTVVYDDEGTAYTERNRGISEITIADRSENIFLPSNIPVKGHLVIENLNQNASSYSRVQFALRCRDLIDEPYGRGHITFSSVPIYRH